MHATTFCYVLWTAWLNLNRLSRMITWSLQKAKVCLQQQHVLRLGSEVNLFDLIPRICWHANIVETCNISRFWSSSHKFELAHTWLFHPIVIDRKREEAVSLAIDANGVKIRIAAVSAWRKQCLLPQLVAAKEITPKWIYNANTKGAWSKTRRAYDRGPLALIADEP